MADDSMPRFRYTATLAEQIERHWQDRWEADRTFEAPNPAGPIAEPDKVAGRPKLFVLDMFPYPSGSGLHVGHPLGYIGTDVFARYKRMCGYNVLHSLGYDAFGLPAEQHAVQTGIHPRINTEDNIATMRRQLRRLGLGHDMRRSISTTDVTYYRWTQWIFLQIFNSWYDADSDRARPIGELVAQFESSARATDDGRPWSQLNAVDRRRNINAHRLAYLSDAPVNWCPALGTVLANEEVTSDGRSERGNYPVFRRNLRQWMMRITSYADRLLADLDLLEWSDAIKSMQRNWIGRSEGARVRFRSPVGDIEVFTTRPDTLFGASFMVLAPEHPLVDALTSAEWPDETLYRWTSGFETPAAAIAAYRQQAQAKSEMQRQADTRDKTGVFVGSYAVNPTTGQPIPVFVADYVLMGYGTGAIMAVPSGDQRDFEFALQFDLPIPPIQRPPDEWFAAQGVEPTLDTYTWPRAYVGDAPYMNSSNAEMSLDGDRSIEEATSIINEWLERKDHGRGTVNYKLRDWLFSRQRYWGEPFPIVYDDSGLPIALPDHMLPVVLPDVDDYSPRTFEPDDQTSDPESPLARADHWVNVELDLGDGPRQYFRETNTMPQWAGSCWYELRYLDPTNENAFVDPAVERYWMGPQFDGDCGGVDLYVGGVEHAVLHLLYARFWHKVLFDLGHVSSCEPFRRLFNQGYIQAYAYKDERGTYVDAFTIDEHDNKFFHDGQPVTRELGKMGKSLKNAVAPDDLYNEYGADTLRLYEMYMGPLDASRPWETRDVVGMYRFLQRIWRNFVDEDTDALRVVDEPADDETRRLLHKTIDGVTTGMQELRFNTAIAKLIELNNHLTGVVTSSGLAREIAEPLALMLSPLVPHLAEELWARLGREESVTYAAFPTADPALLVEDSIEMPIQINGKLRSRITIAASADDDAVRAAALADPRTQEFMDGAEPRKVIVVRGRTINIVV
ncbi:MAG TPA: leucine--tRNA ligase [Acidimicrobiales bacterium]|nr:leucine--tRNA ligase [Acidimicrobiales bacterium]